MEKLIRFFKDEEGATAVEYGIMVALIAVVIIVAVDSLVRVLNADVRRCRLLVNCEVDNPQLDDVSQLMRDASFESG